MTAPVEPGERPSRARRPWVRGAIGLALGVALVVFGVPAVGDVGAAVDELSALGGGQVAVLAVLAVFPILAAASMWPAAVPTIRFVPAVLLYLSCTAVGYVLPAGAAVATAMSMGMLAVLGVPGKEIPAVVLVTGVSNTVVRMAIPVLAYAFAVATGETWTALRASAIVGGVAVVVILVGLLLVFATGRTTRGILGVVARPVERISARFGAKAFDMGEAAEGFRTATFHVARGRWPYLAAAALLFPTAQLAVLWTSLVFLGAEPDPARVVGSFAIVSQVAAIPITPGALGVAEVSLIGALRAAGVATSAATTATLLYRFFTYVILIPLGGLAYLGWNRRAFGIGR